MKGGDDKGMKKGKMGFLKISKGYFCKIVISTEVQEVVTEMEEESLLSFSSSTGLAPSLPPSP